VDSSTLRRLAQGGFAVVPVDELHDLSVWCRDRCETTGDARYCVLADVLTMIYQWDDQGVPTELLAGVEQVLTGLPALLDADPEAGSLLAVRLRDDVGRCLLSTDDWIDQGLASRGRIHPAPPAEPG
jgi:hypothetical protein